MDALLSKEYAAERRRLIDPHRAIVGEAPFGNPTGSPEITTSAARYAYNAPMPTVEGTWTLADEEATLGLTTYLNVVDKDHNHGLDHVEQPERLGQRDGRRGCGLPAQQPHELLSLTIPGTSTRWSRASGRGRRSTRSSR